MSSLKKPIDYKLLEEELDEAIKADELYKLRNDAKLRAIEQRVPTYDHFRNMVDCAHLRPLERVEMQKRAEVSWNHCFTKNEDFFSDDYYNESKLRLEKSMENDDDVDVDTEAQTSAEFLKIWSSLSNYKRKFEYLVKHKHCLKDKLFKAEITSEFLQEFFKLAMDNCTKDTVSQIIEILQIFSRCKRFSLSLTMISSAEKKIMQLLFENIHYTVEDVTEIDTMKELFKTYCVSLDDGTTSKKKTRSKKKEKEQM